MDDSRFDTLARSLTGLRSRRGALSALLGGTLGSLGVTTEATKKPCPPCKKRKAGKCKKKLPDGTACAGGTCRGGSCVAVPPSGPRPFCEVQPAWTACGPNTFCQGGACLSGTGSCPIGTDICTEFCFEGNCGCSGGNCLCYTSLSGATRCGFGQGCGNCTDDATCVARHGAGAFCVGFAAPRCTREEISCLATDTGFCATPCTG